MKKIKIRQELCWHYAEYVLDTLQNLPQLRQDEGFMTRMKNLQHYVDKKLSLPKNAHECLDAYVTVEYLQGKKNKL